MFHLFRYRKRGMPKWPWQRTPESRIDMAVNQFLTEMADTADDTAVAIEGDVRSVIFQLTPMDASRYDAVVRVPGAFPPYLVWASLGALGAMPIGNVLDPTLARQVVGRLLEVASQTRGKSNAKLMSSLLYRMERSASSGIAPIDALVPRFWEEVQRMGALSEAGCDTLSESRIGQETIAQRLLTALNHFNRRYGGDFWISVKPQLEQEEQLPGRI